MFKKRTKAWCAVVSVLLVLSLASMSFSLPAPLMLARTQVAPTYLSPIGGLDGIEGKVVHFQDFAVTTDADTTATMYLGGLLPWRIINESGGSATLTFYDARTLDGNELSLYDQDDVAVPSLTIGDDESMELPTAMAGCTWLVVKGGGAASGFTLVCRR
jgi:hypothetical protein